MDRRDSVVSADMIRIVVGIKVTFLSLFSISTVPTTRSRPTIEVVGLMYLFMYFSVDGVLAHRLIFFAQISYVGLFGMSNVQGRIIRRQKDQASDVKGACIKNFLGC